MKSASKRGANTMMPTHKGSKGTRKRSTRCAILRASSQFMIPGTGKVDHRLDGRVDRFKCEHHADANDDGKP